MTDTPPPPPALTQAPERAKSAATPGNALPVLLKVVAGVTLFFGLLGGFGLIVGSGLDTGRANMGLALWVGSAVSAIMFWGFADVVNSLRRIALNTSK